MAKKQKKSAFLADFRPLSEYVRRFVAFFFMWGKGLDEKYLCKV
jgi:hypothetical protein